MCIREDHILKRKLLKQRTLFILDIVLVAVICAVFVSIRTPEAVKGLSVAPANADGAPFLFNWDGSGAEGDDLYFYLTDGTNTYSFTVESYLCGPDTEVYKKVMSLGVGDTVDVLGFLYWYEGSQPHVTDVIFK